MVSADGVLLTIEDRATTEDVNAPSQYFLVGRDAYNGITLWKREIKEAEWEWHLHLFRSGPFHLARRLVAVGDRAIHLVNGAVTVDITDNHPELASRSGVIALQLHSGGEGRMRFKDIWIRDLSR